MTQESPQGSIYEAFLNRVNERPDADFIYSPKAPNGSAFTFAEVNQISLALANYYLDAGITAGEKVILHLPNTPDFLFTFLALQRLSDESDLLDEGLDSIRIMTLVEKWRRDGQNISFVDLFEDPTIAAWADLLN